MPELPPEAIILWRHLDPPARKALYARHRLGEVVQLHRGAYVDAESWNELDAAAQHRGRARAIAVHFNGEFVFSHLTAAAIWRLPRMVPWPQRPHVAGPSAAGGNSRAGYVRHGLGVPIDPEEIDGLRVTSLCTTVVDVTATVGFGHAVAIADAALRRTLHPVPGVPRTRLDHGRLIDEVSRLSRTHGAARATRALSFADGRADRPGESMSRVSMHLARVSRPELQVDMLGASGCRYTVDFWWPQFNVIGEFDGKYKYTDPEYMGGRTAQQVLYDEKLREDDLRAASHRFTRWPWATAISPTLMRTHLARAGVR